MDDEIKVVVEVPPTGGVSTPEPAASGEQVSTAVQDAVQIAALADAIAQPAPEIAEILRLQGDMIGEIRSLREEVARLRDTTQMTANVVAETAIEIEEAIEPEPDTSVAVIDLPLENIPADVPAVETVELVPEERKQKKSRKWI